MKNNTYTEAKEVMTKIKLAVFEHLENRERLTQVIVDIQAKIDDMDLSPIARRELGDKTAQLLKALGVGEEEER